MASTKGSLYNSPLRVGRSSSVSSVRGGMNGGSFSAPVRNNLCFLARSNCEIGGCVRETSKSTPERVEIVRAIKSQRSAQSGEEKEQPKHCVRCGMPYLSEHNSAVACKYHGHMTGDRGLYALAPPHQGIDGEWTDASGVTVYKWNNKNERPCTGIENWKRRWTCCGVYAEDAVPCQTGRHVSYDDGATRY